jgi:hypothetical protein
MPSFEDKYLDVLQNIEMAIVGVYRNNRQLLDYDVDRILELLWTEYRNEVSGKKIAMPALNENAQMIYDRVRQVCEWRLGRSNDIKTKGWLQAKPEPISVDEIMDCLKRIRKSVKLWNREGGRQGYLYFIDNNIGS